MNVENPKKTSRGVCHHRSRRKVWPKRRRSQDTWAKAIEEIPPYPKRNVGSLIISSRCGGFQLVGSGFQPAAALLGGAGVCAIRSAGPTYVPGGFGAINVTLT